MTVLAVDEQGTAGELATLGVPTDELSEEAAERAVPESALSLTYDGPDASDLGTVSVAVREEIAATTLVAQSLTTPFSDRVGSLDAEGVGAGATLEVPVDPEDRTAVVFATVGDATGEVARWTSP
ncbi:hypothetical protein BRC62_03265 [Halobacteriales archaeon QH_10_67_13]|nr:MAG: hypothetical protein BRC62_03265 [Halobacteriales archaeon QH_10_67_13]